MVLLGATAFFFGFAALGAVLVNRRGPRTVLMVALVLAFIAAILLIGLETAAAWDGLILVFGLVFAVAPALVGLGIGAGGMAVWRRWQSRRR